MTRLNVFTIINGEREYQEDQKQQKGSHVNPDFPIGSAITAIDLLLNQAKYTWYYESAPYEKTMENFRKIAAIIVQQGENHGMPLRELNQAKQNESIS